MIEIPLLAATIVTRYLVPGLKAGWDNVFKRASDELGQTVADDTKNIVGSLWDRVRSAFGSAEDAPVLAAFEKQPEAAAPLIQTLLLQKLETDPGLAAELSAIIERKVEGGRSGDQIIADTVIQVHADHAHVDNGGIIAGQVFAAGQPPGIPPPASSRPGTGL